MTTTTTTHNTTHNTTTITTLDVSGDGRSWTVELDVRDLGGCLDFFWRATAGTLSRRVRDATHGVAAVGALPLGFRAKLGCMLFKRRMSLRLL